MKFILCLLFLTPILYGQSKSNEETLIFLAGEQAFLDNDHIAAKAKFEALTVLNPKNKDAWFNLATTELSLGQNELACEHFYKVYEINSYDLEAKRLINENCPTFRNGSVMSIKEVDQEPKFIYNEKEHYLFGPQGLNQLYVKIIIDRLKRSSVINNKMLAPACIQISINKFGEFNGKVLSVPADPADVDSIRAELLHIFKSAVIYIPAMNNGIKVDLWEKPTLPINFEKMKLNEIFDFIDAGH